MADTDPWVPAVDEVARWVARLTPGSDGALQFTFTQDTVPSAAQVARIVQQATAEVRVSVGVGADGKYDPWIRQLVALEAAAQVTLAFDPQATTAATTLHTWYETGLTRLMALAHPEVSDGTGGGGSTQPITGYVGTPGDLVWTMPPGPVLYDRGLYTRPWELPAWWAAPWPPSFEHV